MKHITFGTARRVLTTQRPIFGHPEHVVAARLVGAYHALWESFENGDQKPEPRECLSSMPDGECHECGSTVDPVKHCRFCDVECRLDNPSSAPSINCDSASLLQALDSDTEAHCRLALAVNAYNDHLSAIKQQDAA